MTTEIEKTDVDKDVLAGEYVLGTLDGVARAEAQALVATDPAFAATVRAWERRLGELGGMIAPVEPPEVIWERIKEMLAPPKPIAPAAPATAEAAAPAAAPAEIHMPLTPQPKTAQVIDLAQRVNRWRNAAVFSGALAAALGVLMVMRDVSPNSLPQALRPREIIRTVEVTAPVPAEFVAVLQKDADSPAFLLTFDLGKRMLTVRTVGAERQADKSYELWLVSDKYPAPRSLGLIGQDQFTVRQAVLADYDAATINRATYAVSLEPQGGSPSGVPTGPVLYSGKLLQATPPSLNQTP